MSSPHGEFLGRLRATFMVEADEQVQTIAAGLLALEQAADPAVQRALVEQVFRAAHSLKGAARAVEFPEVETLCAALEDRFASWKRGDDNPSAEALDVLHRKLSAIAALIVPQSQGDGPGSAAPRRQGPAPIGAAPNATDDFFRIAQPTASLLAERRAAPSAETVRVGVALLDARLLEAEEMLAVKLTAGQRVTGLLDIAQRVQDWCAELSAFDSGLRSVRQRRTGPDVGELQLLAQVLDRNRELLQAMEGRVRVLTQSAVQDREAIGKLVDDLLASSKKLLLLPFATVSASLPKLVRDLCRDQGKQAELRIEGEQIEVDKRILDEIKDPLIHLLRNCVDHGIEMPAERMRAGKAPKATIRLKVSQVAGGKVQIALSDDGAGIDTAKVRAAAVSLGLMSLDEAQRLGEAQVRDLVFRSDLSTSPIITQLSGRGLGLAIVREKALRLGGDVSVESAAGQGTLFRIAVPATRATFRGVLVSAAQQLFVIPTTQVERVVRFRATEITRVDSRDSVLLDGQLVPLVLLADALEIPRAGRQSAGAGGAPVVVLGSGDQRIGFAVDEVLDEQEILVKPLARPLVRVRNVAAATVLGTGNVALVLHAADLLKSARRTGQRRRGQDAQVVPAEAKSVLVAEDSITSRMLIRSVLEAAGYRVTTAVDGLDAMERLHAEPFDALVSDVEMPRLDGFDLTSRIRADRELADLPVVLVTARESHHDRERGAEVGANAYIVKSGFDESALVDTLRRLV